MNANLTVHPMRRVAFAFVGLLAGGAVLFLYFLGNAFRARSVALAAHVGEPASLIPTAIEIFVIYAVISFVGWLLVGLPVALFVRPHSFVRLSWPLRVLIGAVPGPLALFTTLLLLSRGHVSFRILTTEFGLWAYSLSILISIVAFVVYVALLGKERAAAFSAITFIA